MRKLIKKYQSPNSGINMMQWNQEPLWDINGVWKGISKLNTQTQKTLNQNYPEQNTSSDLGKLKSTLQFNAKNFGIGLPDDVSSKTNWMSNVTTNDYKKVFKDQFKTSNPNGNFMGTNDKSFNGSSSNPPTPKVDGLSANSGLIQGVGNVIGKLGGYQEKAGDAIANGVEQAAWAINPYAGAAVTAIKSIGQLTAGNYKGFNKQSSSASYGNTAPIGNEQAWFGSIFGETKKHKQDVNAANQDWGAKELNVAQQRKKADASINFGNQIATRNQYVLQGGFNNKALMGKNGTKLQFSNIKNSVNHKLKSKIVELIVEEVEKFEEGGKMNVIPDGALHARKHNLPDDIAEKVTEKGIPVITMDEGGEITQHAEIELNEIIFTKDITDKLEEMFKQYKEGNEDIAIKAGKLLTYEILENTQDNTGILETIEA